MRRRKGRIVAILGLAVGALVALSMAAPAGIVAQYDFEAANTVASAMHANVSATAFQTGPDIVNQLFDLGYDGVTNAGTCYKADNWPTNGLDTNKWQDSRLRWMRPTSWTCSA